MIKSQKEVSSISLKWGTLKAWDLKSDEEIKLLKEYNSLGSSMSCAMQKDTFRQKEIICQLIDLCNDPNGIYLDWDGVYVTKRKAKKYVMEY